MTHKQLHQLCKQEKSKAMNRYESSDTQVRQDSAQAINAFDELLGQLHKPSAVKPRQFNKAKATALSITALISDPEYKQLITQKIQTLEF